MDDAINHLKQAIAGLEADRARIDGLIDGLRKLLASSGNGTTFPSSSKANTRRAFARKYDQNARELVLTIFPDMQTTYHVGQLTERLKARGFQFTRSAVALAVRQLVGDGELRRVDAPRRSGFSHAYKLAAPKSPLATLGNIALQEGKT